MLSEPPLKANIILPNSSFNCNARSLHKVSQDSNGSKVQSILSTQPGLLNKTGLMMSEVTPYFLSICIFPSVIAVVKALKDDP